MSDAGNTLHAPDVYLVGGGIASLAAAVYLIRDGRIPGMNIHVLEEARIGGSLDASGSPEQGYSMRGTRMYGRAYVSQWPGRAHRTECRCRTAGSNIPRR